MSSPGFSSSHVLNLQRAGQNPNKHFSPGVSGEFRFTSKTADNLLCCFHLRTPLFRTGDRAPRRAPESGKLLQPEFSPGMIQKEEFRSRE